MEKWIFCLFYSFLKEDSGAYATEKRWKTGEKDVFQARQKIPEQALKTCAANLKPDACARTPSIKLRIALLLHTLYIVLHGRIPSFGWRLLLLLGLRTCSDEIT